MRQHLQYVKSRIIEVGWNNCHRLHGSKFGRRSLPFAFIFRWPSFLCFSQARASRRNVLASTGTDAAMRYRSGCRIMSDGVGGEELSAFYVPRPPRRNFCRLLSVHRLRRKHGKHGENGTHDTFRLTCHDILLSLKTPGHRSLVTLQIPPLAQTRSWEHSEWVTCRKDNWIWIGKNGMGHHGTKAWGRWYPLALSLTCPDSRSPWIYTLCLWVLRRLNCRLSVVVTLGHGPKCTQVIRPSACPCFTGKSYEFLLRIDRISIQFETPHALEAKRCACSQSFPASSRNFKTL